MKSPLVRRAGVLAGIVVISMMRVDAGQAPAAAPAGQPKPAPAAAAKPKPAAAGVKKAVKRTPWGAPDLSGVWNNSTITPVQRPPGVNGREFLTDAEVKALEGGAEKNFADDKLPADFSNQPLNSPLGLEWRGSGTRVVPTKRSSLVIDPPDGRIPPLTEEGKKMAARMSWFSRNFESWTDVDTGERCITDGLISPYAYNNNYLIVQTPDHVVMLHEQFMERRIIALDGRPKPGPRIGTWFGVSRGRWEGDTLVVETTNFADKTTGYRWGEPWRSTRASLRLIERFTRLDEKNLDYQYTVDDPVMYTKPFTLSIPMTTDQISRGVEAGPVFEYACHEGNRAMEGILGGSRNLEKAEAAKKAKP